MQPAGKPPSPQLAEVGGQAAAKADAEDPAQAEVVGVVVPVVEAILITKYILISFMAITWQMMTMAPRPGPHRRGVGPVPDRGEVPAALPIAAAQ